MTTLEFSLSFGVTYPPIEEQLNAFGLTLGDEAQRIEIIRNAILMVGFYVATETEKDKMFKRLFKMIAKKVVRRDDGE